VPVRYVLAPLAGVFLLLGAWRVLREGGRLDPAARTWLLIGAIFGTVSLWLWLSRSR
jgi:hypothetical protein